MSDESELHASLRKQFYPLQNWSARKAADKAIEMMNGKLEEKRFETELYTARWFIAIIWELCLRLDSERRMFGVESHMLIQIISEILEENSVRMVSGVSLHKEFDQALEDGDPLANDLWILFRGDACELPFLFGVNKGETP